MLKRKVISQLINIFNALVLPGHQEISGSKMNVISSEYQRIFKPLFDEMKKL